MKKRIALLSISSMWLLLNSCSDVSPLDSPVESDGEVAVRFYTAMQPTVEVSRAIVTGTDLNSFKENQVGIYGLRLTTGEVAAGFDWENCTTAAFHRQMKNKQYIFEEGNMLSPADGKLDYHPSRSDSALAIYAYWPYSGEVVDNKITVDLENEYDLLYTGQVISKANEDNEFDPVVLGFKHALAALAFRFYSDDESLQGTTLNSITIQTAYDRKNIKMHVADGTFQTIGEDNGGEYFQWGRSLEGLTIGTSKEEAAVSDFTMLLPDGKVQEGCPAGITQLTLIYGGNKILPITLTGGDSEKLSLEPGEKRIITFNCSKGGLKLINPNGTD